MPRKAARMKIDEFKKDTLSIKNFEMTGRFRRI